MAVSDQTLLIMGAFALNYLVLWKKNNMIGNVMYIVLGAGVLILNKGDNPTALVGMFGIAVGVISFIFDWLRPAKKRY